MAKHDNVQLHVSVKSGWLNLGESLGSATDRALEALNEEGYWVVFVIPDQWSVGRSIVNALVRLFTLGFVAYEPGLLIIAERRRDSA